MTIAALCRTVRPSPPRKPSGALRMYGNQRQAALCLLIALCLVVCNVAAQQSTATDVQVKAAYLHKFPGFVEWPKESFGGPDTPIVIAVDGDEEVYAELSKLAPGRLVLGRPVQAMRLVAGAQVPQGIHVLYVGARGLRSSAAPMSVPRRRGLLSVSEGDAGWQVGAMLCFVEDDGRIRFDASPLAAEQAGLKLSARLLGVARRVMESAP